MNFKYKTYAHSALAKAPNHQAALFKEKSHLNWLEHRDRNSSIFHRLACKKNKIKGISMLIVNGEPGIEANLIKYQLVDFLKNIFNGRPDVAEEDVSVISQVISKILS